MQSPPTTRTEAERTRYGHSAHMINGYRWVPSRCAMEVQPPGLGMTFQCMRRRKAGPGKLYCLQHAAIVVARREQDD